ncbi:MAG: hypothetical protein GX817_04735 [Elusimicrobia bacterium]|nr:hypothetical protein [Elusimicrobiota bacterium]
MIKKTFITAKLILCLLFLPLIAQSPEADRMMGRAIQTYLEGELVEAITRLDDILRDYPDNKRGVDLMERSALRLVAEVEAGTMTKEQALISLRIAAGRLPESERIRQALRDLSPEEVKDPSPAPKKTAPTPTSAPAPVAVSAPSGPSAAELTAQKKIAELSAQIRNLERRLQSEADTSGELASELQEVISERALILEILDELRAKPDPKKTPVWLILVSVFTAAGVASYTLYIFLRKNSLKLEKRLALERYAIEELKASYNRDTEKLSQRLTEYGKANQRVGELEDSWGKVIDILDRLSGDGSRSKLLLHDPSSNRKAVTGVDPRMRARADSVEVISDIFRDSPRAAEMLRPFLEYKDNRTRANAAVSYYRYDPEKAMAVIREMATSEDKWMRISAAWALGVVGDQGAGGLVETLLEDSDQDVKNTARQSLEILLGEKETF